MARKRSSPPPAENHADDSDRVDAPSDDDEQPVESDPQNDVAEDQNDEEVSQENQEEDEDAESEGEDEDEAVGKPNEQSVEKQASSQGSESIEKSESGHGSGSGSDSESEKSSPVPVKPIRSKPMKVLTKKPDPKPDPKPKRKRATVKRQVESGRSGKGGSKRARVSNGDEKRSGINRVWSEEDEIVILQGMIDYQLANDEDPYSNLEAFYEFVKDSLHVSVSTKQMSDKIRRLKKKYLVNAEKGDDVVFVKPHDDQSFELSKKIWGGGNGGGNGSKVKGGRKKKEKDVGKAVNNGVNGKDDVVVMDDDIENGAEADEEDDEGLDFKAMYPYLSKAWESDVSCSQPLKEISLGNFRMIGSERMRAMEKEWKDMYVKEMQMYTKKLELKVKHAKVALDQMINSDP